MLYDLVKAFDRVPHDWLVANACLFKYPLIILKLSIDAYKLGRVIVIEGVCSHLIYAIRGITAGSVFATIEMRVLLIRCMDRLIYNFPSIDLTVYVDDTSLESYGPPIRAVEDAVEASLQLAEDFNMMRMQLSDTKNVCLASRPRWASQGQS